MTASIPWLALLLMIPLAGAAALGRTRDPAHARVLGGVASGVVALGLLWLALRVVAQGGGRIEDPTLTLGIFGTRPLLGFDALSAVLALTNAIVSLAVIVGAPRARDERPRIAAVLLTEALVLIMLASLDLVVLSIAFVSLVLPARARLRGRREGPDPTRLHRVVFTAGLAPLVAGTVLAATSGPGLLDPSALDLRLVSEISHPGASLVLGTLLLAVFFRMALLPLHSWLPTMMQYGALGSTVLLVASQSGAYLLVRVAFGYFPGDAAQLAACLTVCGVVSALYASMLALVQDDLRRLIGWLSVSQAGIMIVGLCSLMPDGVAGAVVYWISYGTAVTGLALVTWAVQARTGTTRLSALGGLVRSAPRLTLSFAAFSVASVGFPGSLGFVAEDLMVHGVLEAHPWLGILMIVATALNGIALVRALFRAFLGPTKVDAPADLRPRELAVHAGLAALVFGLGLWPAPLLEIVALAAPSIHP